MPLEEILTGRGCWFLSFRFSFFYHLLSFLFLTSFFLYKFTRDEVWSPFYFLSSLIHFYFFFFFVIFFFVFFFNKHTHIHTYKYIYIYTFVRCGKKKIYCAVEFDRRRLMRVTRIRSERGCKSVCEREREAFGRRRKLKLKRVIVLTVYY